MFVNQNELVEYLKKLRGCTPATFCTRTVPAMKKEGNWYYGKTWKLSYCHGLIGANYENAVNAERVREGRRANFEAEPRTWGRRLEGTPLIEHKGKFYVEIKLQGTTKAEYRLFTGELIPDGDIEPWLKPVSPSKKQRLVKPVQLRDYSLDSLNWLKLKGDILDIVQTLSLP